MGGSGESTCHLLLLNVILAMSVPPEGPRAAVISPDDHGGLVTIAAGVTLSWMLLCFVARIYIRVGVNKAFGHDDVAVAVATVGASSMDVISVLAQ